MCVSVKNGPCKIEFSVTQIVEFSVTLLYCRFAVHLHQLSIRAKGGLAFQSSKFLPSTHHRPSQCRRHQVKSSRWDWMMMIHAVRMMFHRQIWPVLWEVMIPPIHSSICPYPRPSFVCAHFTLGFVHLFFFQSPEFHLPLRMWCDYSFGYSYWWYRTLWEWIEAVA